MHFLFFVLFAFFSLSVSAACDDLRTYGTGDKAKMYLFTSLTCPHCIHFHEKVLPQLKKQYVNSGKVQLTIVDLITSPNGAVATSAVRCLSGEQSDKLEDDLYKNQQKWMRKETEKATKVIASYAEKYGMTQEQFEGYLSDQKTLQKMLDQRRNLAELYHINGTPSLVVRKGAEVRSFVGSDKKEIMQELKEFLDG